MPVDEKIITTSTGALDLKEIPKKMIVIGAGAQRSVRTQTQTQTQTATQASSPKPEPEENLGSVSP